MSTSAAATVRFSTDRPGQDDATGGYHNVAVHDSLDTNRPCGHNETLLHGLVLTDQDITLSLRQHVLRGLASDDPHGAQAGKQNEKHSGDRPPHPTETSGSGRRNRLNGDARVGLLHSVFVVLRVHA